MSDLQQLRRFYLDTTDYGENLFDTWERGEGRGDSVTPSTYSQMYRRWITDLLVTHLRQRPGGLLSIGSGNAVVEAALAAEGYRVLTVDALAEAVNLARAKGVDAVQADVRHWSPPPGPWSVVYADGVLGHLYDPADGLLPILTAMRSWLVPGGVLVISNDRPRDPVDAEPAPGVPGFHWLSEEFLLKQAAAVGLRELSCTIYRYQRPLSGTRERAVLTACA